MRRYAWFTLCFVFCAAGEPALADVAHPVRSGVMCLSAKALAILTLPNGDSKTHQPWRGEDYARIANEGGCIDLVSTMALNVYQSFHNTSLVFVTGQDGVRGPMYRVPNIDLLLGGSASDAPGQAVQRTDFPETSVARPRVAGTGDYVVTQRFSVARGNGTIELLQDRRITPSVFRDLWRSGDKGVLEARKAGLLTGGPLLTARLRLTLGGTPQAQTRDVGFPLATLNSLDDNGETFNLLVDTTDKQASRIAEEKLAPAVHGLKPDFQQAF